MHDSTNEHMLERILADNEDLAGHNREHFEELGSFVFNLMSAPGAGKTTLLERTLGSLADNFRCRVIEGDMVGDLDAQRLRRLNVEVDQISTGRSCHLDAQMIARLLHVREFANNELIFIENVGNLVCPAEFPLGENVRVVLLSVTEGDDKPIKYPVIFRHCDAVIFTKVDLLPYVDFDLEQAISHVQAINPQAKCMSISAKTGEGMPEWLNWLQQVKAQYKSTVTTV